MASGVSPGRIIGEIRDKIDCKNLKRVDLITSRDLRNIRRSLGLKTDETVNKITNLPAAPHMQVTESEIYLNLKSAQENNAPPVVDTKTRLLHVLERIRTECSEIDDDEILCDLCSMLEKSIEQLNTLRKRKLNESNMCSTNGEMTEQTFVSNAKQVKES
ncbi:hypothetical protein HHI36_020581 [Cryptolaemus montrouzieri]|uniref:Uncharacterized protein n=1 Tax=Cryptolaemus montrouzieri TaxID=559131 RepID=A0ABD2NBV3_9CUCU